MSILDKTTKWPDLAGRIEDNTHYLPIRVYFEDTDFTGLVYHASYLRWCERGRSDMVRLLGIHHDQLLSPKDGTEPSAFVVRHIDIDYLKPAKIDDILEVITQCEHIGGAHLTLSQKIIRGSNVLIKAQVKVVLISQSGKPMRLGVMVQKALEHLKL
ncbi:MAG: YbgC/FadM family acyl-CoA thioesterase [Pseudomonadota bacterium]